MHVDDVVDLVNNHFTYKDWDVKAVRSLNGVGRNVIITVNRMSPDTTPGMTGLIPVHGKIQFDPWKLDELGVKAHVLMFMMLHEFHDATESARFDGVAPFHPHTDSGKANVMKFFNDSMLKNDKLESP